MGWSWFDLAFPWIGGVAAAVLLVLMFGTNRLRGDTISSRWRDPVWLSWMAVVAYLLHNVEEYGIDLLGTRHAFPDAACAQLKLPAYPNCPIPPAFYLAVNITLFWVAAPLAALLSRRHPLIGLSIYSVIFINALVHLMPVLVLGHPYNPGLFTTLLVFLPLSMWVIYTCFGKDRLSYKALAFLVVWGVVLHAILMVPLMMFVDGLMSSTTLVLLQIVNAGLLLVACWLAEKWRNGALLRPSPA